MQVERLHLNRSQVYEQKQEAKKNLQYFQLTLLSLFTKQLYSYVTAVDNVHVYKCRNGNFQLWLVVSKQDDEQSQILQKSIKDQVREMIFVYSSYLKTHMASMWIQGIIGVTILKCIYMDKICCFRDQMSFQKTPCSCLRYPLHPLIQINSSYFGKNSHLHLCT